MKLRHYCYIVSCCLLMSCHPMPLRTMDKTQHIYTNEKLPPFFYTTIAILPPISFSAQVDAEFNSRFHDSLFDAHLIKNKYQENSYSEKWYVMKYYHDDYRFFKHQLTYYVPSVDSNDQKIIWDELKKMEKLVKDSSVTTIKISDGLSFVLSKYPASHYLLTDICEYYSTSYSSTKGRRPISYFMVRSFVVDAKTKSVIFYDYHFQKDGIGLRFAPRKFKRMFPKRSSYQL